MALTAKISRFSAMKAVAIGSRTNDDSLAPLTGIHWRRMRSPYLEYPIRRENSPPDRFLIRLKSVARARSRVSRRISSAWASTSCITFAGRENSLCHVQIDLVLTSNRSAASRTG